MSSPPSAGSSSSSNSDAEMEEIKSSESESEQKAEQTSKKQELIKYQSLSNLSCEPAAVTASGIRTLSSKYERLLSQATEEIQRLSEEKARLEAAHTKLLGSNVAMAEELRALYLQQREWRDTEKEMLIANEEFATEVENLYTKEEKLMDELEKLQSANKSLEDERAQQKVVVKKMFSENLKNVAQLEMFKKQQRMDEALKLENEQLKLENEFLTTSQKNTSDRFPNIVDVLFSNYFVQIITCNNISECTRWRKRRNK